MISNMRDLGGLKTQDGHTIKPGMLIRSAQLSKAEKDDLKGISVVIDLRTLGEQKEAPDQTYDATYMSLPVFAEMTAGLSHEKEAEAEPFPDMAMLYDMMMKMFPESFRKILLTIMHHDFSSGAILWHCTEGKDRCGMTTALILEVLGVDRDIILEDYLKTNIVNLPKAAMLKEKLKVSHGEIYAESMYHAFLAEERYIQAAWKAMGEKYLSDSLHISDEEILQFRKKVLI